MLWSRCNYLFASVYGWWLWSQKGKGEKPALLVRYGSQKEISIALVVSLLLSIAAGYLTANLHIFFPNVFKEPASYPYMMRRPRCFPSRPLS
jgi:hypothetical protein